MRTKFIKFLSIAMITLVVSSTAMLAQTSTPQLFIPIWKAGRTRAGKTIMAHSSRYGERDLAQARGLHR